MRFAVDATGTHVCLVFEPQEWIGLEQYFDDENGSTVRVERPVRAIQEIHSFNVGQLNVGMGSMVSMVAIGNVNVPIHCQGVLKCKDIDTSE